MVVITVLMESLRFALDSYNLFTWTGCGGERGGKGKEKNSGQVNYLEKHTIFVMVLTGVTRVTLDTLYTHLASLHLFMR